MTGPAAYFVNSRQGLMSVPEVQSGHRRGGCVCRLKFPVLREKFPVNLGIVKKGTGTKYFLASKLTADPPGEVFAVTAGQSHTEEIGPQGARVFVGRKY
jgi:hypothetical protein